MTNPGRSPANQRSFQSTEFPRWEPGTHVTIRTPPPGAAEWMLIMGIYGALFGLFAGCFLFALSELVDGGLHFWEALVAAVVPASLIGAMHLAGGDKESGQIDIDWPGEAIIFERELGRRRSIDFGQIDGLLMRAAFDRRWMRSSHGTEEKVYHARLDVITQDHWHTLITTDGREQHDGIAVENLAPFAQQLAAALGIELRRGEPVERRHKFLPAIANAPLWIGALFVLLCVLSASWIGWRVSPAVGRVLAGSSLKNSVEELGGIEYELSGWSYSDDGTLLGYSFEDRDLQDTELLGLRDALLQQPSFGLNLSGTQVTDAGLEAVAGNPGLRLLDLYGTRVGDRGVETLRDCQALVELNLNRTSVSNAALAHCSALPELKVLRLWGTRVSDTGVEQLSRMTGLRELYLNETAVSSDAVERLRGVLSGTEIHY